MACSLVLFSTLANAETITARFFCSDVNSSMEMLTAMSTGKDLEPIGTRLIKEDKCVLLPGYIQVEVVETVYKKDGLEIQSIEGPNGKTFYVFGKVTNEGLDG